jgi:hypothetical protein
MLIWVFGFPQRQGKQSALEEASEADSTASGEARQRSKPRQRIPGFEGRATDRALLERHAGQHRSSSSTARHETIPYRSLSQTRAGADYPRHGLAMDGGQEAMRGAFATRIYDNGTWGKPGPNRLLLICFLSSRAIIWLGSK